MSIFIVLNGAGTYGLKPRFQNGLRPVTRAMAAAGIRANQVTVFACAVSVAFGSLLLLSPRPELFGWLPVVLFARMALNALDGILAREFGQTTRLGMYLNELGDVVSDVFLILPFAHLPGVYPFYVWIVVVLSVITEMTGVLAAAVGARRRYDGPLGKSDRAIVFGAAGLWIGLGGSLPAAFLPAAAFLLAITVMQRVRKGLGE